VSAFSIGARHDFFSTRHHLLRSAGGTTRAPVVGAVTAVLSAVEVVGLCSCACLYCAGCGACVSDKECCVVLVQCLLCCLLLQYDTVVASAPATVCTALLSTLSDRGQILVGDLFHGLLTDICLQLGQCDGGLCRLW
jgi:hypothetical protein